MSLDPKNDAASAMGQTLTQLAAVIESRKPGAAANASGADAANSYVARLFAKGPDAALKKVGEEATEFIMACKDADRARITAEAADLWFHTLVALAQHGLGPADVVAELQRREGTSGLTEFANRSKG